MTRASPGGRPDPDRVTLMRRRNGEAPDKEITSHTKFDQMYLANRLSTREHTHTVEAKWQGSCPAAARVCGVLCAVKKASAVPRRLTATRRGVRGLNQ